MNGRYWPMQLDRKCCPGGGATAAAPVRPSLIEDQLAALGMPEAIHGPGMQDQYFIVSPQYLFGTNATWLAR